jgi:hypothetical protein
MPRCVVVLNMSLSQRHGRGMACVNQTRPHCVNQMRTTQSKPLAARHGRGIGRACMSELALIGQDLVTNETERQCLIVRCCAVLEMGRRKNVQFEILSILYRSRNLLEKHR